MCSQEKPSQCYTTKKKYIFDILCSDETTKKFLAMYSFVVDSHIGSKKRKRISAGKSDMNDYDKMLDVIRTVVENNLWKKIGDVDDCIFEGKFKLGDKVMINYIPYSQKYIEFYEKEAFEGIIFFVDNINDNMFLIQNGSTYDDVVRIKSLERAGCHYLGLGKSYDYYIMQ